jgi:hypothetical protein
MRSTALLAGSAHQWAHDLLRPMATVHFRIDPESHGAIGLLS